MTLNITNPLIILDSTLREGEQSDGVSFTPEMKLEIARALDRAGVNIIEAGFPTASPDIAKAVEMVVSEGLDAMVLGHARAVRADIDAVIDTGARAVGIFLGATKDRLEKFMKKSEEQVLNMTTEAVQYAKDHGLIVRFSTEDGTRTDRDLLVKMAKRAQEAGADWVSIPDTVGAMRPVQMSELYNQLSQELDVPLAVHCHNDLGLAVANSLAAWEAGARVVDVCVNGLGERCGITDMAAFVTAARLQHGARSLDLEQLHPLSLLVEKYAGRVVPENSPVVGGGAFSHKAGVHTAAVLVDPGIYEHVPPGLVGRHREILVDKHTGHHAVFARLEACVNGN